MTVVFLLGSCAHPVSPSGGPKDMQPPQVLETDPPSGSARFQGNKFTVEFDEFISLENIAEEGLISPPVNEMPDFKVKGKSLVVKFNEDLKPNTTYTVYFGDAIVDITEGNPVSNFTYIFSTGDRVDSLSLEGQVVDAFDLKPAEEVFVLLYKDDNDTLSLDSLPLAVRPYYLSKTDKNGKFYFNGLADNDYLLFAVADMNRNFFFDQPGEAVAFLDSMVHPRYVAPPVPDTVAFDSVAQAVTDSSLILNAREAAQKLQEKRSSELTSYTLRLFTHPDTVQRLLKAELFKSNTLRFAFSTPADRIRFNCLNYTLDSSWLKTESSSRNDTLYWFFKNLPIDTLDLVVLNGSDTLEKLSLKLTPREKTRGRNRKKQPRKRYLGWTSNIAKGVIEPTQQLEITFNQPVVEVLTDSIFLVIAGDTTFQPAFEFVDKNHRRIRFPFPVNEGTAYQLYIPDSSVFDWNGLFNREIDLKFVSRSMREYGVFVFRLHPGERRPYILQLLGKKDAVLREHYFSGDTAITFNYLYPGNYRMKIIYDDNGNKRWDPGNYFRKRQPEQVIFYNKPVTIRANWEVEESWEF